MRSLIAISLILSFAIIGCTNKEAETLHKQNDSLRSELVAHNEVLITLQDVGAMIDSIDNSRKSLKITMLEGISEEDYAKRLQSILDHMKKLEAKIEGIENKLKSTRKDQGVYINMIAILKDELDLRLKEIYALEKVNKELDEKVNVQQGDLQESYIKLERKEQELTQQQLEVHHMENQLKLSKAETFYARASALETVAAKIHFAPNKKKATLREAVGYYRKAAELGKKEAIAKIKELEGKI